MIKVEQTGNYDLLIDDDDKGCTCLNHAQTSENQQGSEIFICLRNNKFLHLYSVLANTWKIGCFILANFLEN